MFFLTQELWYTVATIVLPTVCFLYSFGASLCLRILAPDFVYENCALVEGWVLISFIRTVFAICAELLQYRSSSFKSERYEGSSVVLAV